jgi:hypothetical protein
MTATSAVPAVKFCGSPCEDGTPCRQIVGVNASSGKCIWHDEARIVEAAEARSRGAKASNSRERSPDDVPPPPEPTTLQGVCDWLSWVTGALARGQIDKSVATGCSYALQNLKAALALRDLEAKYRTLEARVEALRGPGR